MGSCASDCLEGFSPCSSDCHSGRPPSARNPHPQHRLASARLVSTENNLKPALNRAVDPACTVFAAASSTRRRKKWLIGLCGPLLCDSRG